MEIDLSEDTMKLLNDEKKKFAILSSLPYEKDKNKRRIEINKLGYELDKNLSGDERLVLLNEYTDELVISFRGSDNIRDWTHTNSQLIFGRLNKTERYKREYDVLIRTYNKYRNKYIILCGHSLGGSIAYKLTLENEDKIYGTYCYNLGFSPSDLKYEIIKRPMCKIKGNNDPVCVAFKKIYIFREFLDPVSILSMFLPNTRNQITNSHSITNFIGSGISENLTDNDIFELIKRYGPILYLHKEAVTFPVNMSEVFQHYNVERRGDKNYLILKYKLNSPTDRKEWITGNRNLDQVETYIFLRPHALGFALHFNINYQYNVGKTILSTNFGNHYFDSTQMYIIFNEDKEPVQLGGQSHSHRPLWNWKDNKSMQREYNRNNIYQEYEGDRPVFYAGIRGNEIYPFPNKYTYKKSGLIKLIDYMNKGFRYDTNNKFVLIKPEVYYGVINEAINQDGNKVDMSIPGTNIKNWAYEISHIGADKRGQVKIGSLVNQYRLTGPVHIKSSEFRIEEDKNNIRPTEYLKRF